MRWGRGSIITESPDGNMVEEGYWHKNLRVGVGRYITDEGISFTGEVSAYVAEVLDPSISAEEILEIGRKASGYGKIIMPSGETHEGYYASGNFHGHGIYHNPILNFTYEGNFAYGHQEGLGTFTNREYTYSGNFLNDTFNGYGNYT